MIINTLLYLADSSNNSVSQQKEGAGKACVANISPLERQKRLRFGIQQFIITLIILSILLAFDANPFWRLPLLFMFWAAAIGYFQAHDKT